MRLACILAVLLSLTWAFSALAQRQIMSARQEADYRASIPRIEDKDWEKFFHDPTTLLYTEYEVPPAYQFASAGLVSQQTNQLLSGTKSGFYSVYFNQAGSLDRFGNGNLEHPWRMPGGCDQAEGTIKTFKLLWLPKKPNGKPWPIVYWRKNVVASVAGRINGVPSSYNINEVLMWIFPRDTIFGEVLAMDLGNGDYRVFEMRTRMRERDYWDIELFRPFPTRRDFLDALTDIDPMLKSQLEAKNVLYPRTANDANHTVRRNFYVTGWEERLPPMSYKTVYALLNRPFKLGGGEEWSHVKDSPDKVCFTPTSYTRPSIVPYGYGGTLLGTDTTSCRRCHDATLVHVDRFQGSPRDWYGFIRGSADGNVSFNLISPESISHNGIQTATYIRPSFLQDGIVEKWNKSRHPDDRYHMLASTERVQ
jgi:hypothetical protein